MATVSETVSLDATPDRVWSVIGEFDTLDSWHPAVASCKLVMIDGNKVRNLTLGDGSKIVERLDSHEGKARNYVYTILEAGPLPVQNYQSTIKVSGGGSVATVTWSSKFEPRGVSEADAKTVMSGVYTAGFAALLEKFGAA